MYALVLVLIIIIVILSAGMWKIFLSPDDVQDARAGKQGRTASHRDAFHVTRTRRKDKSKRKVRRQA